MHKHYSERLKQYQEFVETNLRTVLDDDIAIEEPLHESMAYSLLAGGKRIRPILLLAAYEMLDPKGTHQNAANLLAAATEMIHTYSLIHDDLPCMDDDDLRRGKPSNHKAFGEAVAVLAGDALLNRAYELMFRAANLAGNDGVLAASLIAKHAGSSGMIGGQIIDLESEGKDISLERLKRLQTLKTAALLRAALTSAAKLAKANSEVFDLLDRFGQALGLAFQIKDDILDATSDSQTMGKTVGKDERDTKATFVTLLGLDGANAYLDESFHEAQSICQELSMLEYDSGFFLWLSKWLIERDY